MPYMMMDLLRFVPYLLFFAAVFTVLGAGVTHAVLFFRNVNKHPEKYRPLSFKAKITRFSGASVK